VHVIEEASAWLTQNGSYGEIKLISRFDVPQISASAADGSIRCGLGSPHERLPSLDARRSAKNE
jgi:hypothetical protein